MPTCKEMMIKCFWNRLLTDCSSLFDVRPTDDGFCCSFNTLPMTEQL